MAVLLTCEHAENKVPPGLRANFKGQRDLLSSHRSYDEGAAPVARALADFLLSARDSHTSGHKSSVQGKVPYAIKGTQGKQQLGYRVYKDEVFLGAYSRLVVDLNRSANHPSVLSEFTAREEKTETLKRYYHPFREAVDARARTLLRESQRLLHISVHSFVPELNGEIRNAGIGLLFDPGRRLESELCRRWQTALEIELSNCRLSGTESELNYLRKIRRNYPYRGVSDGHVTALRKQFPSNRYLGIEVEINQALLKRSNARNIAKALAKSLVPVLSQK